MATFSVAGLVAASLVLPVSGAFAANHSLTVQSDQKGGTYQYCQLFTGTASQTPKGEEEAPSVATGELTGIQFGAALTGVDITSLNGVGGLSGITRQTTAAQLANMLSKVSSDTVTGTKTYGNAQKIAQKLSQIATTCSPLGTAAGDKAPYKATASVADGYYLVKQTAAGSATAVLSSPMLRVVGDTTIEAKDGSVTSDKEIGEADTTDTNHENADWDGAEGQYTVDTADYAVGSKVPFRLTGTLPQNIAAYGAYSYTFKDLLSKGFTFGKDDAASVVVKINGQKVDSKKYTVVYTGGPEDTQKVLAPTDETYTTAISVYFNDTTAINGKTVKSDIKKAGVTLKGNDEVTVEYSATLNRGATVGGNGNPNKSWIEFEKGQPGGEGETPGKTPEDTVWAFTYKLDETKVDASTKQALKGAKFKLFDGDKCAVISPATGAGTIQNWVAKGEDAADCTEISVPEDGKFSIAGLDSKQYTLQETQAPEGYKIPEQPFTVTINAKIKEDAGKASIETLNLNGQDKSGNPATGVVTGQLENTSGSTLPSTGGIGTAIFTIVGLGVMALAATGLVIVRRRKEA